MRDESRKEILTRDIIKKELKAVYWHNALILLSLFVVLLSTALFLIFVIINDNGGFMEYMSTLSSTAIIVMIVTIIIFTLLLMCCFVFLLCGLYKFVKVLYCINKNKFDTKTDKLTDLKRVISNIRLNKILVEEMPEWRKRPTVCVFPEIEAQLSRKNYFYKLCFETHKEYYLPLGKLYNWSQINSMNDWQIFRSANIGDEFYLVVANGNVLYAYNTRHFELQE